MNSHFQSSDTAWISSGSRRGEDGWASTGSAGSSAYDPSHATPPSRMITMAGIDQTTSSMAPENSQSGR